MLLVGFVANLLVRPVNEKFHEPEKSAEAIAAEARAEAIVALSQSGAAGDTELAPTAEKEA